MLRQELAVCEDFGSLPDSIIDKDGDPILNFTLAANEFSDLLWNKWQQKILIANNTGADILVLVGRRECSVGNRSLILKDEQVLVIGENNGHLIKTLSIIPENEAVIFSEIGEKNLTVEGWEAIRGARDA